MSALSDRPAVSNFSGFEDRQGEEREGIVLHKWGPARMQFHLSKRRAHIPATHTNGASLTCPPAVCTSGATDAHLPPTDSELRNRN